jgi:hypothetical protein
MWHLFSKLRKWNIYGRLPRFAGKSSHAAS